MENRNKILGINKKTVVVFHRIMLIAMLHNTLVAPCQSMIVDVYGYNKINYNNYSNSYVQTVLNNEILKNTATEKKLFLTSEPKLIKTNPGSIKITNLLIDADINEGVIGVSNTNPLDNAKDNLFKFYINNIQTQNYKAYLTYDLYGVQDFNAVSRSINDRPSTGGYIIKNQKGWTSQREEINSNWLHTGENKILFSIPKGANYQYQIKNVKLEFDIVNSNNISTSLILNNPILNYCKDNQFYIKGFLKNFTPNAKVYVEETPLTTFDGEYEGFFQITDAIKSRKFVMVKAYDNNGLLGQEIITLDNLNEADKIFSLEENFKPEVAFVNARTTAIIKTEGASIKINDSALTENKEISISKIRNIDIPPMSSGLINVTHGGYGFRFLPDGTKFNKPVAIEIGYDESLIPKGHNANEIKTFYFNTKTKAWTPIERDTISKTDKTITSFTDHFTDYINGIIQTPESPETAGFTPTMMSDIKAVDPSSEMTLISPPEVSQKGDANISYPIKIPAGRKGMQPQIAIQYNSEGGNGWLGQGWSISTPSVSIDTKWGVPLFNPGKESEMYTLNGQELMYPKRNNQDWMPNRHQETGGIFDTSPIPRTTNLQFTPRKQAGFARIERLGNATTNYYWKVTNTDGSINWYGGKNAIVPNAVIKDANNNIVHWALYLTEDVFGNCVKYEYDNTIIPTQSGNNINLNGGVIFHIKNIQYTGFNEADYKYEVIFNSTNIIRQDVSINARLGVKQIEPYFLDNIIVKKIGVTQPIRKYKLNIGYGKFKKGQLKSVSELDKDDNIFYSHAFDYYDDVTVDSQDIYFSSGITETICNDAPTPCVDSDNDGICNENDSCPTVAGPISNNGCPESGNNCYSVTLPVIGFTFQECLLNGASVSINGVNLNGNPFYSVNEIIVAMQLQHPTTTYNSSTRVLTISNTNQIYSTISFSCGQNLSFKPCTSGRVSNNKSYSQNYFPKVNREINNDFSYSFSGTVPINSNPECPSFLNYDFLFPEIIPSFDSSLSILGSSATESDNTNLYVGIGIGCKWYTKSTTFGKQWTWAKDKTKSKTALTDINGDGLQDIVIKENGFLYYKPHQVVTTYNSQNEPEISHSFGAKRPINGINSFYNAYGSSKSGNFQITYGIKKVGGFLGRDKANSESETNVYFTDGNGDGLMDIVKNGVVYFNHLDVNNNPTFTISSQVTENMVIKAEPMTIDEPDFDDTSEFTIPAYDVVKVWEAPADGTIKIDNSIQLIDTSKEAVVSVEMANTSPPPCYNTSFNVPQNILNLYRYFQATTSVLLSPDPFNIGLTNQSCASYIATQNYFRSIHRINHVNSPLGEQFAPISAAHNVYLVNGSNLGFQNLCNSVLNPTFEQDAKNYIEGITFPSENIHFYSTDIQNLSFTYLDNHNNFRISSTFNADLYSNWLPNYILPDPQMGVQFRIPMWDRYYDTQYPNPDNVLSTVDYNNYNLFTPNPIQSITPIEVNVFVNGTPMAGNPYNILEQFSNFKSNFENQYPGTIVTLNTSTNPHSVNISSDDISIATITLVNVEDNQSQTFDFSPCSTLKSTENNTVTKWNKVNPKLEKQATELAVNDWLSKGNELNLPYPEIALKQNIILPDNNDSEKKENYHFIKSNNELKWFNLNGQVIEDKKLLNMLKDKTPSDLDLTYKQIKEKSIAYLDEYRKEKQLIAQKWIDEYHKKQNEYNFQKSNSLASRSINPDTCNESPDELCLLFGTQLNATNTNVTNTLITNCTGQTLSVKKGDRIYFRVHSIDNGNSPVNWNPKVTYTDNVLANTLDQNGLKPFESSYSDGFILSKFQPTAFPGNAGTVTITWDSFSVNPSDDVKYEIFKRQTVAQENSDDDTVTGAGTPFFVINCPANVTTTVQPTAALANITMPSIAGSDEPLTINDFYFKVSSSSNVKWKQFEWKPKMICSVQSQVIGESGPEGTLTSNSTVYPIVDYSIYKSYPCSPKYSLYNTTTLPTNSNLRIKPYLNNIFDTNDHDGILWFVVKKDGVLIGKRQISISHQTFLGNEYMDVSYIGDDSAINIAGLNGNIEIGFYTDESNLYDGETSLFSKLSIANTSVRVYYGGSGTIDVPKSFVNLFQRPNPKFGPMLQQWGQFMYNPEFVTGAISSPYGYLIKEENLIFNQSNTTNIQNAINNLPSENVSAEAAETALDNFEAANNALLNYNSAFLVATPNKENNQDGVLAERWIGLNKENYASALSYRAATLEQSFNSSFDGEEYEFQSVLETGAFGINKKNKGSSKNISGGFSVEIGVSVGANASKTLNGNNTVKTDYVDFNGDRYPDIITRAKRQYTTKTGGLNEPVDKITEISKAKSSGWGIGAQASFGKGGDEGGGTKGNGDQLVRFEGFRGNSGGPLSGNFSKGESITDSFWIDINGDGLTDFVKKDSDGNVMVNLNVGYNQEPDYTWNLGNLFNSKSTNISAGTGFNKWNGSAEWGVSLTSAWNNTTSTLIDMNGDGLLDYVNTDDNIIVTLNTGNKFAQNSNQWSGENLKRESVTVGATSNLGATAALVWPLFFGLCLKAPAVSLSKSILSTTTNKTKKVVTDFDGDGYPDLVEQTGFNTVKIYHSRIRRTDKLKSVTNPLGGKFTIDYKVQPLDYNNPQAKWAMSDVIIEDNYDKINDGNDVYKKHFTYENGKYDRREREFYGYKTVKAEDYTLDISGNPVLYRTSISNYHNQSYFLSGLLDDSYVIKGGDINKKFSRTKNYYNIYKLNNTNDLIDLANPQPETYDVGGTEGRRSASVLLTKTVNELYELSPSPQLTTEVSFKYDTKGRVIEYFNKGNINNTSDDYTSTISYHTSMPGLNIINVPQSIKVSTASGGLVRERKTDVDTSNGNITSIFANNSGSWLETNMEYYPNGNLKRIVYPENTANERMSYEYTYDTDFGKYVVKIIDAFGYSSSATYNSDFDKIVETIDMTGNKMKYKYDSFGRNTFIIAPKEIEVGAAYTIKFEYYPYFSLLPPGSGVSYDPSNPTNSTFVPVAITKHYDPQHPTNDIETYTFIDGLARPIQVKKDVWLNKTNDPHNPDFFEGLSISGKTFYDELGRATKQFHPWWENKSNTTKFLLNEHQSSFVSTTAFDELDRPIKSVDPEGNESYMEYSLDTDVTGNMAIKTKSDVDQNGSQHIITETFKDVSGRVIATKNEGGSSGAIWTKFEYNEIGELLSYTDTENISTTYKYDMLGRKIMVDHPDNGLTVYNYDNVNLVSMQTANLQNSGGTINYKYEINRLTNIEYPNTPDGNSNLANVTYKYGNTGNQTGRLIWQQDATGSQDFDYGNMGEMISNTRTVVGPNIPTRVFKTSFEYDSWNRLQTMVYPDGEKIVYDYDLGGNLNKMTGEYNGNPYSYIERIDYDYYEQRTFLLYGNKTETVYNYTPTLRRLENLNVKTSDGNDLFFNEYAYDRVGNILGVSNSAGVTANNMAGKYEHRYEYDELNRLIAAEGSFDGSLSQIASGNDANASYYLKMKYNDTHGILNKDQGHIKNGNTYLQNTYVNDYKYINGTHKVETIIDNNTGDEEHFKYDLNGNITNRDTNTSAREFSWDESNRLRVVSDNNSMQHYIYDASGERVLKANSDMEAVYQNGTLINAPGTLSMSGYTSYPSAFIVITADDVYSKHYYAGPQRIVSRLGDDDASIFEIGCSTCKQQSTNKDFDPVKLQVAQKKDLQNYADKLKKGTVVYKDYKPIPLAEQEKAINEENKIESSDQNTKLTEERAAPPTPIYFYHPDQLGTSTALTDFNGDAYQFFLNLPFGETMAQQLGSNYYNSPYKFNGKELDEETGLYYYGARYYDPRISIFQSVDQMTEKYPSVNPYAYCFQNPINLIDPTGMEPDDPPTTVYLVRKNEASQDGGYHATKVAQTNGEGSNRNIWTVVGEDGTNKNYIGDNAIIDMEKDGIKIESIDYGNGSTMDSVNEACSDFVSSDEYRTKAARETMRDYIVGVLSFPIFAALGGLFRSLTYSDDAAVATETSTKLLPQFTSSTIDDAVSYAMKNKIPHVFGNSAHKLDPLVAKLGGQENTFRAVLNAANGKLPASGVFNNISVNVGGFNVTVRGSVVDGIPKIGTMFIP